MGKSLSGLSRPPETYENRWDRGLPKYQEPSSVRDMALILLKIEAMTEAALQGYGALISHAIIGRHTVECTFQRGIITKSVT